MIEGSCACGGVRIRLTEPPRMMGTCHCSRCRKVGATTFVFVRSSTLEWVSGRELVQVYSPEPGYKYRRAFCGRCGTALGEITSDEATFPIAANLLDGDPAVRNRFHEFTAEKPPWYEIFDGAKQFAEHPSHAG
jgi:hypothetical protein